MIGPRPSASLIKADRQTRWRSSAKRPWGRACLERLIAGYLLAVGVLLLASAISRSGGAVTGLVDGASTLMWIAAVVALVGIVLSGEAAEGAGIAIRSMIGLAFAWLVGVTPGPLDALQNIPAAGS